MNFKKMLALVLGFFAIDKIPMLEGKLNFSEDQKTKLKDELGDETFKEVIAAFNKEIEENAKVKNFSKEIKELLKETNLSEEEVLQLARSDTKSDDDDPDAADEALKVQLAMLTKKIKGKNEIIEALINGSEDDIPLDKIKGAMMKQAIKHSATHLFGSGKAYDALAGRDWNKAAAQGLTTSATDFSEGSTIDKLNGDLSLFYRENPDVLKSLHRDNFGLPADWDKRMNVVDKIASGTIATAEISQARKLPWLAKNKQAIKAEEGQIFPISIDIEFVGHLLSSIEASWLSAYNREGSQAYKMSFVRFLVSEIDKRARLEDRIATIKGVYVATPDDATVPGKFINRQNGLLYLAQRARDIDKKYRAFDIGVPTTSNIVDYVESLILALPIEVRNLPGLELQISPYWRRAYRKRYRQLHGLEQDFKGEPDHPKDYANIKFQELVDYEGHDFMLITFSKNVQILENIPKEKSLYKFEMLKRIIYIFADYKLGVRFIHIGSKVKAGDPDEFKVQTVWSNSVPIFKDDFYAPVHDDTTGEIDVNFDRLQVAADWGTDIAKFNNVTPGTLVRIQGNTALAAVKNVKDNVNIELAGDVDFDLQLGGTLTMYVKDVSTLVEISRTAAPAEVIEEQGVYGDDGVVDADLGSEFAAEHTATTAITGVVNGVEGKIIKLYGTDTGGVDVTLSTTGNISLTGVATLGTAADYIELILVDGTWAEINRVIA